MSAPPGRLATWAPALVVLLGAVGLGVANDLPSLADPVNLAPETRFTDPQLLAISLVRANLAAGHPFSASTPLLGWPDTADFRPVVWPMLVLGWFVPAGVAFNVAVVALPALNALGGIVLGRALGLGRWERAALGAALALHSWLAETLANGQLEQSWLGGVALAWALAWWGGQGARWALVGVAPFLALLTFTGPHLAIAAGVGMALLALGEVVRQRGGGLRAWVGVLVAGGLGAALAGQWYAGNFSARTQVFWPKGSPGHGAELSSLPEAATLAGLLFPPAGPDSFTQTLHPVYLGWFLLLPMIGVARRAPRALWVAFLGLLLLAFGSQIGPFPGPFRLLAALSPAITQSQSPYRMLGAGIVAGAALAAVAVRSGPALLLFVAAGLVEGALVTTRPFPLPAADHAVDPLPPVLVDGAGAVLDLPTLGPKCPGRAYHHAIEAARRGRPSPVLPAAPAFYPTVPALVRRVTQGWQGRPCGPALAEAIRGMGFSAVVLHRREPGCPVQPSLEQCLVDAFGPGTEDPRIRVWTVPDPAVVVPLPPQR